MSDASEIVLLDMDLKDGVLTASRQMIVPFENGDMLWCSFDAAKKSKDYEKFMGGLVYVGKASGPVASNKSTITIPSLGDGIYKYSHYSGRAYNVLAAAFPPGYTIVNAQPRPNSAKVFNRRIAVFIPRFETTFTMRLKPIGLSKIQDAVAILNAASHRTAPPTSRRAVQSRVGNGEQHAVWRLATIAVILSFALAGLYMLREDRAFGVLWFLFFVLAVPPVLAYAFESSKLKSGRDLIEIYRVGVRGIPFVSRLISGRQ